MIRLVGPNFVPVALNADRLPATDAGRFFRALLQRWPQGLWVVTPAGETLGFHYHRPTGGDNFARNQQRWADDTVTMLTDAVAKAGPLPPRTVAATDPFPDRGRGLTVAGGVRLAVSVIGTRNGRQEGPPVLDSITLDADDWVAFVRPGNGEWTVPEAAAKRFAPALSPVTDSIFVPRPADVTTAVVTGKVVRDAGGRFVVRYRGEWRSLHHRDGDLKLPIRCAATGDGVGVYDPATGKLVSLVWVLTGTAENTPTAAVVEWEDKPGAN